MPLLLCHRCPLQQSRQLCIADTQAWVLYGGALSKDDVTREITVYAGFIKHRSSICNKALGPHRAACFDDAMPPSSYLFVFG